MDANELRDILEQHKIWLNDRDTGKRANLSEANLSEANLSRADLSEADLIGAKLHWANLSEANLSACTGLLDAEQWLLDNFRQVSGGLLVYKAFGETPFTQIWEVKEGLVIEEVVNPCSTNDCGCGVNFGTLEFVRANFPKCEIRECILPPFVQVVVPYNTDGKARCAKLIVGKVVDGEEAEK